MIEVHRISEEYFQIARKAFKYLELDFNYQFVSSTLKNPEDYRDTQAELRYMSDRIGIKVYWYFASAIINLELIEKVQESEFPQKKHFWGEGKGSARAITLHTLLDFKNKSDTLMLKKVHSLKSADIRKRDVLLREKLDIVMESFAVALRQHAHDILLGDTTAFSDIHEYAEKLMRERYPARF